MRLLNFIQKNKQKTNRKIVLTKEIRKHFYKHTHIRYAHRLTHASHAYLLFTIEIHTFFKTRPCAPRTQTRSRIHAKNVTTGRPWFCCTHYFSVFSWEFNASLAHLTWRIRQSHVVLSESQPLWAQSLQKILPLCPDTVLKHIKI